MSNLIVWHIVDPETMLIVGRRFARKSAVIYVRTFNKKTGRELKVMRSDTSLKQGYRNAASRW